VCLSVFASSRLSDHSHILLLYRRHFIVTPTPLCLSQRLRPRHSGRVRASHIVVVFTGFFSHSTFSALETRPGTRSGGVGGGNRECHGGRNECACLEACAFSSYTHFTCFRFLPISGTSRVRCTPLPSRLGSLAHLAHFLSTKHTSVYFAYSSSRTWSTVILSFFRGHTLDALSPFGTFLCRLSLTHSRLASPLLFLLTLSSLFLLIQFCLVSHSKPSPFCISSDCIMSSTREYKIG
jgi:hypothetical protein